MGHEKVTTAAVENPEVDRIDPVEDTVASVTVNGLRRGSLGVSSNLLKSVVKIFSVRTEPNLSMPWQMKRQYRYFSHGCVYYGRITPV